MRRTTDANDGSGTATGPVGTTRPAWRARPGLATAIRLLALCGPVAISVAVVLLRRPHCEAAGRVTSVVCRVVGSALGGGDRLPRPAGRLSRRLLPLAALMRLSLVFPDSAPSSFRTALRTGTVATLEERLTATRQGDTHRTPIGPAQLLLELVAHLHEHDPLTRGHSERSVDTRRVSGASSASTHESSTSSTGRPCRRHRQARVPHEILASPPQADGGRVGDTPHAPDVRCRARGPAAGVAGRVERRDRAAPRAVGRNGYPLAWPAARSRWRAGSSRSRTCST